MKKFLPVVLFSSLFLSACSSQNIASPSSPTSQANNEQTLATPSATSMANPIPVTDQTSIKNLVTNFYTALTNQNGKVLFNYMTPPSIADEKSNLVWLTGSDLGTDQFYRVFLRIKISQPQLKNIQKLNDGSYQVMVADQIQGYSNGPVVGSSKPQQRNSIVLTVVDISGKWLVDKFDDLSNTSNSGNAGTPKYSGFGQ